MKELTNFGMNTLTKAPIKWTKLKELGCYRNGEDYTLYVYCSDVVKIITVEELFDYIETNNNFETSKFDEIIMPTLTLAQQESAIEDYKLTCYLKKTPKHIRQIFTPVKAFDYNSSGVRCDCYDPDTGEILNFVSDIHGNTANIGYIAEDGTLRNMYISSKTSNMELVKGMVGDRLGVIIRYYHYVRTKDDI